MSLTEELSQDLKTRLTLCHELLQGIERESQALRRTDNPSLFEFHQLRKKLLPALTESLANLRRHRLDWQRLSAQEREQHPEITALLRQNQDLTMKILLIDRENEQGLLRRGLMPAREIPSVNRQRPHFVADLYRRQSSSGPSKTV